MRFIPSTTRNTAKYIGRKTLKAFRLKEAPYAITLLVASLGWSVTHVVDRLIQTPMIEYKLADPRACGSRIVKCEVTNICDKVFRNLNLYLSAAQGAKITLTNPEIGFVKPIMPDPFRSKAGYIQGENAAYFVPELQPLCTAQLEVRVDGTGHVDLRYSTSGDAIRLVEHGFQTWVVKNEVEIVTALFIFWLLALVAYICFAL